MKKNKILVICGQTATGKTDLAFYLAEKYNGEIISADSRQVYREMDIGTGKDIPNKFNSQFSILNFQNKKIKNFTDGNVKIWGLDIVNPNQEFSVSHYREYALKVINKIHSENKLPIIVGGTGFYIEAIFADHDLIDIPKNKSLRSDLENKSTKELFDQLMGIDKELAESLNNSEKNNKQRLIRRIEIASNQTKPSTHSGTSGQDFDLLFIGLKLDKLKLKDRIKKRIQNRIDQGFEDEYKYLLNKYGKLELFNKTPGYKDWADTDKWLMEELKYAKRQLTWFKRKENIKWFEADDDKLETRVENLLINFVASR